jgi:hypothetical protein
MRTEIQLGHLLDKDEPEVRDAIHIAVATVEAGEFLSPGQRIGLTAPGIVGTKAEHIGIVDPFLTESVLPGEKFHICLFPYTITSLRHQWAHPAFEAMQPVVVPLEQTEEYLESKRWLENYADSLNASYEELMEKIQAFVEQGDYWCEGGRFEGEHAPDMLFDHYEVVMGTEVSGDKRGGLFSCSC